MSDIRQSADDEIDLLELFGTIWDAKWTILLGTVSALAVGLAASFAIPKTYTLSTPIKPAADSVFIDFLPIASFKKKLTVALDLGDAKADDVGVVDGKYVFDAFVSEFNDYEEIVEVIKSTSVVADLSKELTDDEKNELLLKLAKQFKLTPPSKAEGFWDASFKWRDADEGIEILQNAMLMALQNTKEKIINEAETTSDVLQKAYRKELEDIQISVDVFLEQANNTKEREVLFLRQQSAIAQELGMSDDQLTAKNQIPAAQYLVGSERKEYMRGFKAINKEIELLESETQQDMLRKIPEYVQAVSDQKRLQLELKALPATISEFVSSVKDNKVENWVDVNLASAEVKSNVRLALIAALSLILGGILSIIAVLISKAMRERKAAQVPH